MQRKLVKGQQPDFSEIFMHKKIFAQLAISAVLLFNLAACSTVDKLANRAIDNSTPEKRAFQEKPFSSDAWLKGDAQTRGEMTRDLGKYESVKALKGKKQDELIKILGEPDKKTTGKCCHVRFADEVEVWLYKIESPETNGTRPKHNSVQVFFSANDKTVMELTTGAMEEKPAYFPMVG